jgi:Rrf2 family protein
MIFSKSFGYAIRSIVYLASLDDDKPWVQLEELAKELDIPRHFLGKVLNRLVKEGILDSLKGHNGGFKSNDRTLSIRLSTVMALTGDLIISDQCALHLGKCNEHNPCPVHHKVEPLKKQWNAILINITIAELLKKDSSEINQQSGSV